MPRRRRKSADAPSGPQSAEWVQSAAASFDAEYRALPAGQVPSAEASARAIAAVAGLPQAASSSGSAGDPQVPLSQVRLGNVNLHRHSGEGLVATGFEPQRHSVMVLGRPVQASLA